MKERAENVQKLIDGLHGNIDLVIESQLSECESPIEMLFGIGLLQELGMLNANPSKQEPNESIFFEIQQELKIDDNTKYRVDFIITMYDAIFGDKTPITDWETQLIVECDGWDYHSTKEQVSNDNERDRIILTECGIPTIRFTGREINKNPCLCARNAIDALKGYNSAMRDQISVSVRSTESYARPLGPDFRWMTIEQSLKRIQDVTKHDELTASDLRHFMKCDNYIPRKQDGIEFIDSDFICALLYEMGTANF